MVYIYICQIYCIVIYILHSILYVLYTPAPAVTGSVFMRKFSLILQQFAFIASSAFHEIHESIHENLCRYIIIFYNPYK